MTTCRCFIAHRCVIIMNHARREVLRRSIASDCVVIIGPVCDHCCCVTRVPTSTTNIDSRTSILALIKLHLVLMILMVINSLQMVVTIAASRARGMLAKTSLVGCLVQNLSHDGGVHTVSNGHSSLYLRLVMLMAQWFTSHRSQT